MASFTTPSVTQCPFEEISVAPNQNMDSDSFQFDSLRKCVLDQFNTLNDILVDKYEAPIVQTFTPLEIQMAEQLKKQAHQMEEMKQMMEGMQIMMNPFLEAEKERKMLIAKRKAEEERKAEEARKAEEERKAEKARKAEKQWRADTLHRWHKAEEARKAKEARKAMEEYKQREIAEHPMRQEEARKRSGTRIGKEFMIGTYRGGFAQLQPSMEVIYGAIEKYSRHYWNLDRTSITVDGKVCVGPRLGCYMGIMSREVISTYSGGYSMIEGSVEPTLYTPSAFVPEVKRSEVDPYVPHPKAGYYNIWVWREKIYWRNSKNHIRERQYDINFPCGELGAFIGTYNYKDDVIELENDILKP